MTYSADSPLDGAPLATAAQAVAFLIGRGVPPAEAAEIVADYFDQSAELDPIIAIAQAVLEASDPSTGRAFASWWCNPPRRNPCGLGVTGAKRAPRRDGDPAWQMGTDGLEWEGYAFVDRRAAAAAHLGHLGGYRWRPGEEPPGIRPLVTPAVDPRLPVLARVGKRGTVRTLRGLDGNWAVPGVGYGGKIAAIANLIAATPAAGEGGTLAPRIAISSGHHNADGGDAYEKEQTGKLTQEVARACRALGMDVRVVTPDGPDPDQEAGDGMYGGGLQSAARVVVGWHDAGWRPDIYLETHTEGGGGRGVFAIYPDAPGDLDADVRDRLGPLVARKVAAATGLGIGGVANGTMSETRTGVGGQGWRLGIFAATEPIKATCTRLIIEYGAHDREPDLTLSRDPRFYVRCGQATAAAFAEFIGLAATAPTVPAPPPADRLPLPFNVAENPAVWHCVTAGIDCWVIEPAFLAEYRALGDRALRLFGLPIAGMGPDPASGRAVQYFQRARFELRPDGGVDFGLVGSELLRALGQAA